MRANSTKARHARLWTIALGALVSLSLARPANAQPFVDVTPAQEDLVRDRMDQTALYEASLNVCGSETDAETRIVEAMTSCIEPDVLERLSDYWKEKLADLGSLGLVPENTDEFCRDPELTETLDGYLDYIDDLVAQAEAFCE